MGDNNLKQYLSHTISGKQWKKIDTERRAGLLVPLFSVYSQKSLGVGDLQDLKLVIDFAEKTGNSIIQLLPMNEAGSTSCPYDSITSFALDPLYLAIEALPNTDQKSIRERIEDIRKVFPVGKPYLDYKIKKEKVSLLWEIFNEQPQKESVLMRKFIKEHSYWLDDFALFKVLKDYHKGASWFEWEARYRNRNLVALEHFRKEHKKDIEFEIWIQWLLHTQFKEAKKYAAVKNIFIKGDLPILVSFDSADVWAHPEYFKLEFAAGAPPDMYCEKGQRWGTPTYNWDKIAQDEYLYLKEKLKCAEHYYDILRVDHVVGLFRIWSISVNEPAENKGLHGFFDPYEEYKWGEHGRNLLSVMLLNTRMLLCAEDLGVVPRVCVETLREFGIPGNEVQRWTKDWNVRHDFLTSQEYRDIAVSMLSTHDTTNWAAWWENEAGTVDEALFIRKCNERRIEYHAVKSRLFDESRCRHGRLRWHEGINSADGLISILGRRKEEIMDFIDMYENSYREKEKLWAHFKLKGQMRESADQEIVKAALQMTLASSSIFCIQLIIDWFFLVDIFQEDSYQYRINTPGTVNHNNWSLTLPMSLEKMLTHKITKEMKAMNTHALRV